MARIIVKDLHKEFKTNDSYSTIIKNISFTIDDGQFVCIVGPSGCGKTTILNSIAGILNYSGEIKIEDNNKEKSVKIGYVFQNSRLLNWLTIKENVLFSLQASKFDNNEANKITQKYLSLVGINEISNKYPLFCSEGEKIRTSIARALAIQPDILLMDEPFSHLDEINARNLRTELLEIWQKEKRTIVFVTHNTLEAIYMADNIYILSNIPTYILNNIIIDLPRPRNSEDSKLIDYQKIVLKEMGIL